MLLITANMLNYFNPKFFNLLYENMLITIFARDDIETISFFFVFSDDEIETIFCFFIGARYDIDRNYRIVSYREALDLILFTDRYICVYTHNKNVLK